jgi:hypothetical protein
MKRRFLAILSRAVMRLLLMGLTIPMAAPASAQGQVNSLVQTLSVDQSVTYMGTAIHYSITLTNVALTGSVPVNFDLFFSPPSAAGGSPPGGLDPEVQLNIPGTPIHLAVGGTVTYSTALPPPQNGSALTHNMIHPFGVTVAYARSRFHAVYEANPSFTADDSRDIPVQMIWPSTTVTIVSSPVGPVIPGSMVPLTVTETNNTVGPTELNQPGATDITSPSVVVTSSAGGAPFPLVLNKASGFFSGGDGGIVNVLDGSDVGTVPPPGETWTWIVPGVVVNSNTTFTANGDGIDFLGNHVNFDTVAGTTPGISTERAPTTVNVILPDTNVTISSSASHVSPGGKIDLIITETNTGSVSLTSPRVDLTASPPAGVTASWTLDVTNLFSGDGGSVGVLDASEVWTWHVNGVVINAITDFTAIGHGFVGGTDITAPPAGINPNEKKIIRVNIDHPHTTLSLTTVGSVTEVPVGGGPVTLTIIDTNDGDVDLINPYVVITKNPTGSPFPLSLGKASAPYYISGDSDGDGIHDPLEAWKWQVTVTVTTDTTFTAVGHGTDPTGTDITYPGYPERGQVSITIPRVPGVSNLGIGLMIAAFAAAIALFATRRGQRRPSLHS